MLNWDISLHRFFAFWCYLSRKHWQICSYSRASDDLLFVEEFPSCHCHRPVCWVHQVINILTVFIGQSLLAPTERVTVTPELQQRFHFHPLTPTAHLGQPQGWFISHKILHSWTRTSRIVGSTSKYQNVSKNDIKIPTLSQSGYYLHPYLVGIHQNHLCIRTLNHLASY